MLQLDVDTLKNQLTVARNEINKLRHQVKSLQYMQRKDIEGVTRMLNGFRCEGCRQESEENTQNSNEIPPSVHDIIQENGVSKGVQLNAIGVIRTDFPEKRAVPRQSSIGGRLRGIVQLNSDVFTNPEHSLEGLEEYSHMWIIYHFHKNNAHPKAKVAPPRLGGERVGVFSTRSPHRPCPIGLSLVEIDKIDGASIAFFGTDMVDGTPVLDIKPYIPVYDNPTAVDSGRTSVGPIESVDFYNSRQDPDGEESELELLGARANICSGNPVNFANSISPPLNAVKVPNWITAGNNLSVYFDGNTEAKLEQLQVDKQCIVDILAADPRSVYLRKNYERQVFTFQLSEVTVTCQFNDKTSSVAVIEVRRTENVQDDDVSEQ